MFDSYGDSMFSFLKKLPNDLHHVPFSPAKDGSPIVPHLCQRLVKSGFWTVAFLGSVPHCSQQAFLKLTKSFSGE